jgi:hypothetical protein
MSKKSRNKRSNSLSTVPKPAGQAEAKWCLRLTPELRGKAKSFRECLWRIWEPEQGEFSTPPVAEFKVRLTFPGSLERDDAAGLVSAICAASGRNLRTDVDRFNRLRCQFQSMRSQADDLRNSASETSSGRAISKLIDRINQCEGDIKSLGS